MDKQHDTDAKRQFEVLRRSLEAAIGEQDMASAKDIATQAADLAENQMDDVDRAVSIWKVVRRLDESDAEATGEVERLLAKAEKWNALVDVLKSRISSLRDSQTEETKKLYWRIAEIYRDELKLGVMVINTYNAILKVDPEDRKALDALAKQYQDLGRWNDLIHTLEKMVELSTSSTEEKVSWLHRVSNVWAEQFGNYGRAAVALEKALSLDPSDEAAVSALVDIYERRRQWRPLVSLLAARAINTPLAERVDLYRRLADLSLGKLMEPRLAVTWWNRVLELPNNADNVEAIGALQPLYERTKNYWALAEITSRQVGFADSAEGKILPLERLAVLWADKLKSADRAFDVCQQILEIDPEHRKAKRLLRALFIKRRDVQALSELYGDNWQELVEAIGAAADNESDESLRVGLLLDAARVVRQESGNPERSARAYERVLVTSPGNDEALKALAGIYQESENWGRLVAVYETQLGQAEEETQKNLVREMIDVCEDKLGATSVALKWAMDGVERFGGDSEFLDTATRLATQSEQWEQLNEVHKARLHTQEGNNKIETLLQLGENAWRKLHDGAAAKDWFKKVLDIAPANETAQHALESLATESADWGELIAVYEKQLEAVDDDQQWASIAMQIAAIQETRAMDLDAAAEAYKEIVGRIGPEHPAVEALVRVEEARGNWQGLAEALTLALNRPMPAKERIDALVRLATLRQRELGDTGSAMTHLLDALEEAGGRKDIKERVEALLADESLSTEQRSQVALALLPHYDNQREAAQVAAALEIARKSAEPGIQVEYDNRLFEIYTTRLREAGSAYEIGMRLLKTNLMSLDFRTEMVLLARELGQLEIFARALQAAFGDWPAEDPDGANVASLLAELWEELGDMDNAVVMWDFVREAHPSSQSYFSPLERLYKDKEDWEALCKLLADRAALPIPHEEHIEVIKQRCYLLDAVIGDDARAAEAYKELLAVEPGNVEAYRKIERVYRAQQKWDELLQLFAREVEQRAGDDDIAEIRLKRADLLAAHSGTSEVIDALAEALHAGQTDATVTERLFKWLDTDHRERVIQLLEPVYRETSQWDKLAEITKRKAEDAPDRVEQGELLAEYATLLQTAGAGSRSLFEAWCNAFVVAPDIEEVTHQVKLAAADEELWPEVANVIEMALDNLPSHEVGKRTDILMLYADCSEMLGDHGRSKKVYEQLIAQEDDPVVVERGYEGLSELLTNQEDYATLAPLLEEYTTKVTSAERRLDLLAECARIYERGLRDQDNSLRIWLQRREIDPVNRESWDEIIRIYRERENHRELADTLRMRVSYADDEQQARIWTELGDILADHLDKETEAAQAYEDASMLDPENQVLLRRRARLYRKMRRWQDLCDVLRELISRTHSPEPLELELADILADKLEAFEEAAEICATILSGEGMAKPQAASMLRGFVLTGKVDVSYVDTLRQHYRDSGDIEDLVAFVGEYAANLETPDEAIGLWRDVARLREQVLTDRKGAMQAAIEAASLSVGGDLEVECVEDLERLAGEQFRSQLTEFYESHLDTLLDPDILERAIVAVCTKLARNNEIEKGKVHAERLFEMDPSNTFAIRTLETIYRKEENAEGIYRILQAKLDHVDEPDARADMFAELGDAAWQQSLHEEAIQWWEQRSDLRPTDLKTNELLIKAYRDGKQWYELVSTLEKRASLVPSLKDAANIRFEIGQICEQELSDLESAVDNYAASIDSAPDHDQALSALERLVDDPVVGPRVGSLLEPIYVARHDWMRLVRVREAKLEGTDDVIERRDLMLEVARLWEDQLEDLANAYKWYVSAVKEDPSHGPAREQLERLSSVTEQWAELVELYREISLTSSLSDSEIASLHEVMARVYDQRLSKPQQSVEHWRQAFTITQQRDLLLQAEAVLVKYESWQELCNFYEDMADLGGDDEELVGWLRKLAELQEQLLSQPAASATSWERIFEIEPQREEAHKNLIRLYNNLENWQRLRDVYEILRDQTDDDAKRVDFELLLADLWVSKLNNLEEGVDVYERLVNETREPRAISALEQLAVEDDYVVRVTEALEPIYRDNDWWQKLVVILDAKTKFVDDPHERIELFREIASIHDSRGGDQRLALDALTKAWLEDPRDHALFVEFREMGSRYGEWKHLVVSMEKGLEKVDDPIAAADILSTLANIVEHQYGDRARAAAAWQKRLQLDDGDMDALSALDRIYTTENNFTELANVLSRISEVAPDEHEKNKTLARLGQLLRYELKDLTAAAEAWEEYLLSKPESHSGLTEIVEIYAELESWDKWVEFQQRLIEVTETEEVSDQLRLALADRLAKLDRKGEAIAVIREVSSHAASETSVMMKLLQLYKDELLWPEAVGLLDQLAAAKDDGSDHALAAAKIVQEEMGDIPDAIDRYAMLIHTAFTKEASDKLIEFAKGGEHEAFRVLEEHYTSGQEHAPLAQLYRTVLEAQSLDIEPEELQKRLAKTLEEAGSFDEAFDVWCDAMASGGASEEILGYLQQNAEAGQSWGKLCDVLAKRATAVVDGEEAVRCARLASAIAERQLSDFVRAGEILASVLPVASEPDDLLLSLDRLYTACDNTEGLKDILTRRIEIESDTSRADLLFRLADLLEQEGDINAAVQAYTDVLDENPGSLEARDALERLVRNMSMGQAEVLGVLENLYRDAGESERLARVLEMKALVVETAIDRATVYRELLTVLDEELGDDMRALDVAGSWLASDPDDDEAIEKLLDLTERTGRWPETAARLRDLLPGVTSTRKPQFLSHLGRIELRHLADFEAAKKSYTALIKAGPLDLKEAWQAMVEIERQLGNDDGLESALVKLSEQTDEPDDKVSALRELAFTRQRLGKVSPAVDAWMNVLEVRPDDESARSQVIGLWEQNESWAALVDFLEDHPALTDDGRVTELMRIASIREQKLSDPDGAASALMSACDIATNPDEPLALLEQVQRRRRDWHAVLDVLGRRVEMAENPQLRAQLLSNMADICESEVEDIDGALQAVEQLVELLPQDTQVEKRAIRLYQKSERWHDLIAFLERQAAACAARGDAASEVKYLAQIADVWDRNLDDQIAAGEILEKILERDPSSVRALTGLAQLYQHEQRWEDCGEILKRALALQPTGEEAASLYYRLAKVSEAQGEDEGRVIEYFNQALQYYPEHAETVTAYADIARKNADTELLVNLLERKVRMVSGPEFMSIAVELAAGYRELGQADRGIPLLEEVVKSGTSDTTILTELADLYFDSGRLDEAEPIYQRLQEEARRGRKMKDVAQFSQRLAGILEAQADTEGAMKAYEEAFRLNPSNAEAMVALGRLYVAAQEWSKAQRVYRSLVLQTLEPRHKITKAQVYFWLGYIHAQLGETQKAKGMYHRARDLDPNSPEIAQALEKLEAN